MKMRMSPGKAAGVGKQPASGRQQGGCQAAHQRAALGAPIGWPRHAPEPYARKPIHALQLLAPSPDTCPSPGPNPGPSPDTCPGRGPGPGPIPPPTHLGQDGHSVTGRRRLSGPCTLRGPA